MEWLVLGRWLLALAVLAVAGAPLAAWLFPRLRHQGAAFSLPVSLLSVAVVTFVVGQLTYGVHTAVAGVLLTAVASAFAYRAGAHPDWRAVARAQAILTAGVLVVVAFRAAGPTLTPVGGEQFLHFGVVNSLARAPSLPPEDVWFAGEPLRYYYGTQLQVVNLSLLTGTPLRYGFNLGIATFYGVLVVSAYGLASAVAATVDAPPRLAGGLGVFFAAVAGPLTTTVRLAFGLLPADTAVQYGRAAFGFAATRSGRTYPEMVAAMSDPGTWFWWYTRYVIPGTLQEVPLYSFVKADLHGHALSTGYLVVAAALAFSYYRLPAARRGRRLAVLFGGLGVVAGVFGFMNTWALPTAAGLTWLTVASADAHPRTLLSGVDGNAEDSEHRLGSELRRLGLAVVPAVLVGAVGVAIASPFLVFGSVPENGGVGLFPPRSPLAESLVVYGALLALVAGYLVVRSPSLEGKNRARLALGGVALGLGAVLVEATVLAVLGALLVSAWWFVRTDRLGFEGVLLVAGLGLLAALEVLFAKVAPWPSGPARWNTSLKVAVQGWTLAAVGAGVASARLLARVRSTTAVSTDTGTDRRAMAGVLVVCVVLASSTFPLLTAGVEVGGALTDGDDATLDGLAGHEQTRPAEMAAIEWLGDRTGTPTVVEAPGQAYRWASPAATMTGLPGLVGWTHHQENYRPDERVQARVAAVERIYTGEWNQTAATLRAYDVRYVWVGPRERQQYGDQLQSFEGKQGVEIAFENEAVTVWRVDQQRLPTGT